MSSTALTGLGARKRRRRLPILPLLSTIMLLTGIGWFVLELVTFSQREERLPTSLTIAGVQVGNLLFPEAARKFEQVYAEPLVLYYNNSPILLDPASIGFRVNREPMLAQAQNSTQVEGGFWLRFLNHLTRQEIQQAVDIPLSADYQRGLLEQFLQDVAARYDRPPGKPGFDVQTLTTFAGTPGFVLDIAAALPMIEDALYRPNDRSLTLPMKSESSGQPTIETLRDLIIAYLDSQGFVYGSQSTVASIYVMDLLTGDEINLNSDVTFSAASTMKVAILIDYFRYLNFAPSPEDAWLMAHSLLCSNNSSSNLIMQIIGNQDIFAGIADVTRNANYIGARNTFITAPFYLGVEGQQLGSIPTPSTNPNPNFNTGADPYNQITTEDLGTLFAMIYDCEKYASGLMAAYPNGEFTQQECRQMMNLMSQNNLLRLLQGGIPPGVRIAHKNGWLDNEHGDAGIVFPPNGHDYVIAVFLWEDVEFMDYNKAWSLIEGISRAAWNYFSDEPLLTSRNDLPTTAQECEPNFLPPFEQLDLNDEVDLRTG